MIEPPEHDASGKPPRLSPVMRIVAALAICAPLLAPLGSPGLLNPDEGRYTEIGREMAATGDWMVPRLHGIPHWAKPPLSYWVIGASLRAFGTTERAARLPSAIAATLGLLATWFLARRMGGALIAVLSVVVLATMLLFHALARFASADMIQAACITWAAALTWHAREPRELQAAFPRVDGKSGIGPRLPPRLGAFACLGVAFLDKGPVGLGVCLSALLVYWILRPRALVLSWRHAALGILAVLAVGLPWFLYVSRLHPDLFDFFLGSEVRDRYLSGRHHRTQPFWFLPAVLVGGTLPWTPIFAASVGRLVTQMRRQNTSDAASSDAARFLLAWIVGPFVLFSFSGSKLATYLLPLMPFCAIATARWIAAIQESPGAKRGWLAALVAMPAAIAAAAAVGAKAFGAEPVGWGTTVAIVSAASILLIVLLWRPTPIRAMATACAVAAIVLAWEWTVPWLVDEQRMSPSSHASYAWVRDALANAEVRGIPISPALRPSTSAPMGPAPTFASYELRSNTLPFYLLGTRAEFFRDFGNAEGWEMKSDQEKARTPEIADLVLLLRGPESIHVLTRRDALAKLEDALGHPLLEVAVRGSGAHAVVLVSNR